MRALTVFFLFFVLFITMVEPKHSVALFISKKKKYSILYVVYFSQFSAVTLARCRKAFWL